MKKLLKFLFNSADMCVNNVIAHAKMLIDKSKGRN